MIKNKYYNYSTGDQDNFMYEFNNADIDLSRVPDVDILEEAYSRGYEIIRKKAYDDEKL